MTERTGGERRAFLRRSLADAATLALEAAARSAPLEPGERAATEMLEDLDHLVVLSFAARSRAEVFGVLDGESGPVHSGDTDDVMTAPGAGDPPGSRFAPGMLPVHTLLATAFARADHGWADGRDPLLLTLEAARRTATPWALCVDERQGVSTTLLADPEWPLSDPGAARDAGGRLVPLATLGTALASGSLPPVVLVEPRSLVDPADFAPAAVVGTARSADARVAEQLLHTVVDAVRGAERAGRRILFLVLARGSSAASEEVPVLVVASRVRPGARIDTPLGPDTPALLVRARAGSRRALADPQVLALGRALGGGARPLSHWPRTASAFAPAAPAGTRLDAALRTVGLAPAPAETTERALARLRAAASGASLHSDQAPP